MNIARPHRAFFLIAATSALAYVSLPRGTSYYDRWYQLFGIAAVVATLVGVRVNQPRSRAPWFLVALSGLCAVGADAVHAVQIEQSDEVRFASAADVLVLGSSVVLVAALLLMIRKQEPGRDWPSLVDAGIVTAGIAIVGWTFLVEPHLARDGGGAGTAVALATSALDLLLVSLAARMLLGPAPRTPASAMVTTALLFQLVGDALYGYASLHGWYRAGDPVDLLFVASAILLGTAALHPSMAQLTEPIPDPGQRLRGTRLAVLGVATLMAPAMLAVAAARAGNRELLVVVGGAAALSTLVVVRLAGAVARHERSAPRERALADAAAALVSAATRDDIYVVAVDAALELVGSEQAAVQLEVEGPTGESLVAEAGARSKDTVERTVVPLEGADGRHGAFVVHTRQRLSEPTREAVATLAEHVALALESVATAEGLHERQSAERFRSLVQNSTDVIFLLARDLTIRYHTPSVERVLRYQKEELVGRRLTELLDGDDAERVRGFFTDVCELPDRPMPLDLPLRRGDGSGVRLESIFNNLLDHENVAGVVVTARDVTERRALEEQLAQQAFHDDLTGLANRALFSDRIAHALARGARHPSLLAVLFVDLDDFTTVNDSLGHAAGDQLLVAAGKRIQSSIRPEDTCARLGGDEFAVMIEDISEPEGAVTVARRILARMAAPLLIGGSEVTVQGSVGIVLGAGEQTPSELMRSAELAMHRAKTEGKGRYALYEPSMHERVLERLALKADLQRAAVSEEFEVHYQPIVVLHTGEVVGVEALVRWRHPVRGLLLPSEFIPLAEETGMILPLGSHVLHEACVQVARWRRRGAATLGVNVNISARQLASRELSHEVSSALEASGLDPSALVIEITEGTLLESHAAVGRLQELKKLGVRIAIDDFGTGYSSLNYLRRFPVDYLKLARPFVEELGSSPDQEPLVAAILRLGTALGLETVAEGIERESQLDRLRGLNCRFGQGFLYSRPLPPAELDPLLLRQRVA